MRYMTDEHDVTYGYDLDARTRARVDPDTHKPLGEPEPMTEDEVGLWQRQVAFEAERDAANVVRERVDANTRDLHDKAAAALDANRTYLAIATPTTAQMRAQLGRVTRQTNALIRLVVGLLDDTSDT